MLSLMFVLLFSYGHIYSFLEGSGISADPKTALIVYIILFAALLAVCFKKIQDWKSATAFLNGMALVLIVLVGIQIGFTTRRPFQTAHDITLSTREASAASPDIFYIILDGYPREDILQKIHGFSNSTFLTALETRGFRVLKKSHSNYAGTSLSLAATLNHDYLDKLVPLQEIESRNQWYLKRLIEQSRVLRFLKTKGYETVAFDSGYFQTEMKQVDRFLATGWFLNEFHEALLDTTPAWVVFKNVGRYETQRRRILYILDQLPTIQSESRPVFVFAHVMALHPPFVFGPNGEERKQGSSLQFWKQFGEPTRQELSSQYQEQLSYINKRMIEAVTSILQNRTRPVCIVIQGDHGSSFESPQNENDYYQERFSILNAVLLPHDKKEKAYGSQLYESMSSVNTFRAVFNELFDARLPLLADRSFYSIRSRPYDWTEVTQSLKQ